MEETQHIQKYIVKNKKKLHNELELITYKI